MMTQFQEDWMQFETLFDIKVIIDPGELSQFETAQVIVSSLDGHRKMVIFHTAPSAACRKLMTDLGIGYTTYGEPKSEPTVAADLEEMLADWGLIK